MSGWDAMLRHEAEERKTRTPLERRRELSRMSKTDLISLVMRLEDTEHPSPERDNGSRAVAEG